jgi:hypothetical protein
LKGNIKISGLCLDNKKTRFVIHLIEKIEKLVEFRIPAPDRETWTTTIDYYESTIEIFLKHEDLMNEEIVSFQWNINCFAQDLMIINMGDEGVTNYIHDLQGGHISDYLKYWHNLYILSQQDFGFPASPACWFEFEQLLKRN